ncbi:MAG: winged helix DNA-binding domain-containing protein [Saprospiraceae bacterium]|nr:winged helix DNA-binding domain-containing protein [Saprospiraceae bacterium]
MSRVVELSKRNARRLMLRQMGLAQKSPFGSGKKGVLQMLLQLGYVQIDTISVIKRAHHHVVWTRVPKYQISHLEDLITKDRSVMEYWAHAAAFLPMRDYRHTLVIKNFFKKKLDRWPKPDLNIMTRVYDTIKAEGPMMARDFGGDGHKASGWWNWKPAKWALERLFLEGDLVVSERRGFQKVYDLPERVIPSGISTMHPSGEEHARYLICQTLQAHGLATVQEICYQRKGVKAGVQAEIAHMVESGQVHQVRVETVESQKYYALSKPLDEAIRISKQVRFLSPFDNAVIQRKRLRRLFDFDYQIECYVPKAKRKFGYFALPILFGDTFIGRVDCKADRKSGVLHIFLLTLHDSVANDMGLPDRLLAAFVEFAKFNGCSALQLHESNNPLIADYITQKM